MTDRQPAATASQPGSGESVAPRAELVGISKRFAATQALDDVSLVLMPGEVRALVGENGAGKSTLVKILAGVHQPDSGTLRLDGAPIVLHGPAQARALGIAVVRQEPRLFPDLSVAENVYMGHPPKGRFGSIAWRQMRQAADRLFDELGVSFDVSAPVRGLSMADQQLIEIAKALSVEASVLILDEPTASLSAHEVERLFTIVRQTRDRKVAVLFVSHRLDEVFDVCDTATVLRDGRLVVNARTSELTTAGLVRYMVGREVSLFPKVETPVGEVLLEVKGLSRLGAFEDVSFKVRGGEIVGMAGLVGAGRSEVARVLFGIDKRDSGEVILAGQAVTFDSPSAAMTAGIAYVPEDRHQQGLVLDFPITSNVTLPILSRLFPGLLLHGSVERKLSQGYAERLRIRMTSVEQSVDALSGGNQQKVVLAKWLATEPQVLILDEPTRGIDIGAKVEVHRIISELAASGLGIILISSDLPEVLAMSDRIVVLHEGHVTAEIARDAATEETVMYAATGQQEVSGSPSSPAAMLPRPDGGAGKPGRGMPMARAEAVATPSLTARIVSVAARQRELSLVVVMAGLGVLVAIQAPQFLSASNLTSVLVLSAIIAIAAVGEALVIMTRNVDLSVEAMMGLVAFSVADLLKFHVMGVPEAMVCGLLLGLALGMFNGFLVAVVHVPSIVATLGTLSIYRGLAFLAAGGKQVTLTDLPHGYTDSATQLVLGVPLFVIIAVVITIVVGIFMRQTEAGRQVYAVGSNPEAATIQGIRTGTVIFAVFAVCGLLSGVAGILWSIEFGTMDATAASGVTLQVVAAVVVGGVNIFGGSGTVMGAALGAVFLGFISNALILVRLSQFWLQAVYGVVILVAVSLDAFVLRRLRRSDAGRKSR